MFPGILLEVLEVGDPGWLLFLVGLLLPSSPKELRENEDEMKLCWSTRAAPAKTEITCLTFFTVDYEVLTLPGLTDVAELSNLGGVLSGLCIDC